MHTAFRMTRTRLFATAGIASLFILASTGTAEASVNSRTTERTYPMRIDCASVTEAGKAYAIAHGLNFCGIGAPTSSGEFAMLDQATDDCGESHIYMYQGSDSGDAFITWGYTSNERNVIHWDLSVDYDGNEASGSISDSGWLGGSEHEDSQDVFTGRGRASASLSGTIETLLYSCYVEEPSSSAYIG